MEGLNGVNDHSGEPGRCETPADQDATEFETIIRLAPTTWLCIVNSADMPNQLASPKKNVTIAPHLQERLREVLDEIVSAHVRREIGTTAGIEGLTGRQREIVDMVRQGASNKIIARDLGLSVGTVKVHMHRIFRALQINNRVQLALLPSHSGFDIEPSRAAGRFSEARAGRVA